MAPAVDGVPRLAGRQVEVGELRTLLDAAALGQATTVIISGEAGVGKTSLVRRALEDRSLGTVVLSGGCLPMRSVSVSLLPLRSALRSAAAADTRSAACLRAIEEGWPTQGLDAYLDAATADGPVVVFVDDVQWAG